MNRLQLFEQMIKKRSFLCVGLDSEYAKIPGHLKKSDDPIFEFNQRIIEVTAPLCVAYKLNLAFYESEGAGGWISFEKTVNYIREQYPEIFIIADAKRGDIGNTSALYARAFFEKLNTDAVTVAPYMGEDSVTPFLKYPGKWVILLALTSNHGAGDFQFLDVKGTGSKKLFEVVIETSAKWGTTDNLMYVVGATQAEMLSFVRKIIPGHFLLVPGIGAQGGSLEEVARYGINRDCGLLVNASRSIIFASSGEDFAEKAKAEALSLQKQMKSLMSKYGLL